MVDQHTELSITSADSSLTNNTEVSNTNSNELSDKDGDSKFDCEYEVRNCFFVVCYSVWKGRKEVELFVKIILIWERIEGYQWNLQIKN